ncbi:MAG: PHP domain-containing protein [bacterium]|nr:PHP domain-containing protein [bacterium]
MSYSKWLKMDLHIHSHESNKTKNNDYDGGTLTYERLVAGLSKENVNLFSITDHNTLNLELYKELLSKRHELIEKNMNFIIGAELDFEDDEVHDKVFHMLTFFDTDDIVMISKLLASLFGKERIEDIGKSESPINLKEFFKKVFLTEIKNIVTIPHFNEKDKGIPANDIDKFVYTVFNALEDSNNRNSLVKSINVYKKFNYTDVPVVVFSDNHDIDIYPCGKDKNKEKLTSMHILGNLKYPFNSIRAAFQDVNTRISIKDTGSRNTKFKNKHIKLIKLDDSGLEFSPYQNSIIGGFGTGKSFLLDLIINGKSNVDTEKYGELVNKYDDFHIKFSDDTTRNSLNEVSSDVKIIRFNQYKDIYFKDKLYGEDRELLEGNLHIKFPVLDEIEEYDTEELISKFNALKSNIDNSSSITDIVNYDALNRSDEKEYSIKSERIEKLFSKPEYLSKVLSNLKSEYEEKVLDRDKYHTEDQNCLKKSRDLIIQNNDQLEEWAESISEIMRKLDASIQKRNQYVEDRNGLISSNLTIWDDIKKDIIEYSNKLEAFKVESNNFEKNISLDEYIKLKNYSKETELYSYKFVAKYDAQSAMPNYKNDIFKQFSRKGNLFQCTLKTLIDGETFAQSKTFEERLNKYISTYYGNFNTICYDIIDVDKSILRKSAGEKANVIMNLIFDIIEENSKDEISSIVILDQPEDNLDNKGIQEKVVERIRYMKSNNYLPQLICVTHNANISITADSENIILANKFEDKCSYINSGIEDSDFIDKVCKTVEGGSSALRKRGIKFNIPFIKEIQMEA